MREEVEIEIREGSPSFEALVRQANAMAGCRSFDEVVRAIQAMRALGVIIAASGGCAALCGGLVAAKSN